MVTCGSQAAKCMIHFISGYLPLIWSRDIKICWDPSNSKGSLTHSNRNGLSVIPTGYSKIEKGGGNEVLEQLKKKKKKRWEGG